MNSYLHIKKSCLGVVSRSIALTCLVFVPNLSFAHENYSARYVIEDEVQDWVKYDEGTHGARTHDTLKFKPGTYISAGLGQSFLAPEGSSNGFVSSETEDGDSGFRLAVGRHFKPHWAWEISYVDMGLAALDNSSTLGDLVPNAGISYTAPAAWIKYLPLNPNRAFGLDFKVGIASIDNEANDERIGFEEVTSAQIAFGMGAQYRFAKRLFARVDLESYDRDALYAGLAVGVYFGGHSKHRKPVNQDSDHDGVIDKFDHCLNTRLGDAVDSLGCPLPIDSDGDGVFNQYDNCPDSPLGTKVDKNGCRAVVVCNALPSILDGVYFEVDSAELKDSARLILDAIITTFNQYPALKVEIQAHTDSYASETYNLDLSKRRAASVLAYLMDHGVKRSALVSSGYGEARPIGSNDTKEGRAKNRRVELHTLNDICEH